jgi:predicted ATPase with chaperone activity
VRERVTAACQTQADHFKATQLLTNADMGPAEVRRDCALDGAGQRLMQAAMRQLHLSARAYHRVSSWRARLPTSRELLTSGRRTWPRSSSSG